MKTLDFAVAWDREYITIRYNPEEHLIWNEWRGVIPSFELREAMIYTCKFILTNKVELMLEDYTRMSAPSIDDQIWVSNHTADLLLHSKLRRVANIMSQDLFQRVAIDMIHEYTAEAQLPCEYRDFVEMDDALDWLLAN